MHLLCTGIVQNVLCPDCIHYSESINVSKVLKPYSCLEVGADVLDIAGTVIASKELKYDPVSNCKPSTAFQISLTINSNWFVILFFRLALSPLQRDKCGISMYNICQLSHKCTVVQTCACIISHISIIVSKDITADSKQTDGRAFTSRRTL